MKNIIKLYAKLVLITAFLSVIASAQSGGTFSIEQSVIASGGGTSSGGEFRMQSTIGQPVAGTESNHLPFNLQISYSLSVISYSEGSGLNLKFSS